MSNWQKLGLFVWALNIVTLGLALAGVHWAAVVWFFSYPVSFIFVIYFLVQSKKY